MTVYLHDKLLNCDLSLTDVSHIDICRMPFGTPKRNMKVFGFIFNDGDIAVLPCKDFNLIGIENK